MKFVDTYYKTPRPDIKIDSRLSQKLRALSYLGAFCVVCLHFAHFIDTSTWVSAFLNDAIIRGAFFASVSMFFMFSGMLLVKDFDGTTLWWKRSIQKRVKTLLVPYLFWCIAYGVAFILKNNTHQFSSVDFWLRCFGISPYHPLPIYCQMWYVRNLFLLCLVSPLLIVLVNWISRRRVLEFVSCAIFVLASVLDFPLKDQTVMAMLYFMAGIYLGFNSRWLKRKIPNWISWTLALLLVIRGIGRHLWGTPSPYLHWIVFAFTIAWVWRFYDFAVSFKSVDSFLKNRWMVDLQSTSFFLYCFHMWIVLWYPHWPICMNGWVLQPVLQSIVVLAVAYVLYLAIRKYAPILMNMMTGGR